MQKAVICIFQAESHSNNLLAQSCICSDQLGRSYYQSLAIMIDYYKIKIIVHTIAGRITRFTPMRSMPNESQPNEPGLMDRIVLVPKRISGDR